MARKIYKPQPANATRKCRECQHSYDWHNSSIHNGALILCRCKYDERSGYGKFCKFLYDPACERFMARLLKRK